MAPDPSQQGTSLRLSGALELNETGTVVQNGELFLWGDRKNFAAGRMALANLDGDVFNDQNTAVGAGAAESLVSTGFGSVTAIGAGALNQLEYASKGNVAIGAHAGSNLTSGSGNIFISNPGLSSEEDTIRIGLGQDRAYIAGALGLGFDGFDGATPVSQLDVRESLTGFATPGNHVVRFLNTSATNDADVLALQVAYTGTASGANNFVTFFDGDGDSLGAIQGNNAGSVTLVGAGNDFAEWLPRRDPTEPLEPGDVVGLVDGAVTRETEEADQLFVVSTSPLVTGNDPGERRRDGFVRVAFVGQAEVRVVGGAENGQVLVPSGRADGTAVAKSADALTLNDAGRVLGRVAEGRQAADSEVVRVRALVESPTVPSWTFLLEQQSRRLQELERRLTDRLQRVEHALANVLDGTR